MDQQSDVANHQSQSPFRNWGLWAVIVGALALGMVFVQIGGPMLSPKPSAATQVGEIAGEIKRSAWRSFLGLPKPAPKMDPVPAAAYLALAAPLLGILAVFLSLISGLLRENWRYAAYGVALGVTAIVFQYFWWVALLVAGVILLVTIIANIGDIFSF